MKRHVACTLLILLGFTLTTPAQAPICPMRVKVSEIKKRDVKERSRYQGYSTSENSSSGTVLTYYTIEMAQPSKALADVEVKWSVLVRPRGSKQMRVASGSQTCSLEVGGKTKVDTDSFETASVSSSSTGGYYGGSTSASRTPGDEIVGYSVDISIGGQVVFSESKPIGIKTQIEQVRSTMPKPRAVER